MRWLLLLIGSLFASMAIGLVAKSNTGYVLIHTGTKTLEMKLPLFILILLAMFLVFSFLLSVLKQIIGTKEQFSLWFSSRKKAKARKNLLQGLIHLAEGRYKEAQKKITENAGKSDNPVVNYLAAAIAAHCDGDSKISREYLKKASSGNKKSALAVGFIDALLHVESGKDELAIAKLIHLNGIRPNHKPVLTLLFDCYRRVGDWQSINAMSAVFIKQGIITKDNALEYEYLTDSGLLDAAVIAGEKELKSCWSSLSKISKHEPSLIVHYAKLLIDCGLPNEAEKIIRESIPKDWDPALIEYYGKLKVSAPEKMLSNSEGWLKKNPRNPALLLTAARLAERSQIWGRARSYYEACVDVSATPEPLRELGLLLEHLEEPSSALDCYRLAATIE